MATTDEAPTSVKFGTFTGVFTPTLLTILGVIMYVRMGWVVGNAGLAGSLMVLGLAMLITACTGLSLSSIATNTRIGDGGPYAIMNKSLGLEVGGSIGIPLYLTRPLGIAMYIFGFREGLLWVVPELPPLLVDLVVFGVLWGIAYASADLAFKTQYVIMAVIAASLASIFFSPAVGEFQGPMELWGDYRGSPDDGFAGTDFWGVFAVFFPATTGILAGANMSGDLEDPRRAIPVGTLAAIALSAVIYVAIAVWCANVATLDELTSNYNVIIDKSLFPPLVLMGLLGATASSALAGLVGGPRILMAMGQNRIVPFSDALAQQVGGEPRNASLVTGVLTLACIMLRDLNAIAPLVTMFFLITYCMINVVVLVEGSLGLVSYRPTLQVPLIVPLIGLVGCTFSMFIVNPTFSLISVGMVVALYFFIRRRGVEGDGTKEDVRSGIFLGFAEWAASKVTAEDFDNVRAWKPHLLVPVENAENLRGSYKLLLDLSRPEGSVKMLGLGTRQPVVELEPGLKKVGDAMREEGVLASWSLVDLDDFVTAVNVGAMALQGAFFRPNLLFLDITSDEARQDHVKRVLAAMLPIHVGAVLFSPHPSAGLGQQRDIRLWVRRGPDGWDPHQAFASGNLDLQLLMGFRLWRLWRGKLILCTIAEPSEAADARAFLDQLADLARLPASTEREVAHGELEDCVRNASTVDLSVFGLQRDEPNLAWGLHITEVSRSSCLFVLDSGRESARA
jgi:amino acid transporter